MFGSNTLAFRWLQFDLYIYILFNINSSKLYLSECIIHLEIFMHFVFGSKTCSGLNQLILNFVDTSLTSHDFTDN
jgi:hypothetical protein